MLGFDVVCVFGFAWHVCEMILVASWAILYVILMLKVSERMFRSSSNAIFISLIFLEWDEVRLCVPKVSLLFS